MSDKDKYKKQAEQMFIKNTVLINQIEQLKSSQIDKSNNNIQLIYEYILKLMRNNGNLNDIKEFIEYTFME